MSAVPLSRRTALAGFSALAACGPSPAEPVISQIKDGECERVALPNNGFAWLSRFNIATTMIDHIGVPVPLPVSVLKTGHYYPASASPAFRRDDATGVLGTYLQTHGAKAQTIINASFFERYDASTELSFPIKQNGQIITGGSSPYGPYESPADDRYKTVTLQALVWNDRAIRTLDYDHKTGSILNDPQYPDGLVTYRYQDHPANVLSGDPVGQYQLLGVTPTRDGGYPDILFVLTIVKGRMAEGAQVLKRNGVGGAILTLDGGPSTHLWTKNDGVLLATESKSLPHFLGFRAR